MGQRQQPTRWQDGLGDLGQAADDLWCAAALPACVSDPIHNCIGNCVSTKQVPDPTHKLHFPKLNPRLSDVNVAGARRDTVPREVANVWGDDADPGQRFYGSHVHGRALSDDGLVRCAPFRVAALLLCCSATVLPVRRAPANSAWTDGWDHRRGRIYVLGTASVFRRQRAAAAHCWGC